MDIKSLMIGDWVYNKHHGKNIRLTQYDFFTHTHNEFGKQELAPFAKLTFGRDLEPLPLTPEILEKNGFEVQDQGGGRKDVWTGFGIDCEGDIEVEFQNNIPVYLKIDGRFKGEYYTSANIKYVHELQHVLRLCGISKEIEL